MIFLFFKKQTMSSSGRLLIYSFICPALVDVLHFLVLPLTKGSFYFPLPYNNVLDTRSILGSLLPILNWLCLCSKTTRVNLVFVSQLLMTWWRLRCGTWWTKVSVDARHVRHFTVGLSVLLVFLLKFLMTSEGHMLGVLICDLSSVFILCFLHSSQAKNTLFLKV